MSNAAEDWVDQVDETEAGEAAAEAGVPLARELTDEEKRRRNERCTPYPSLGPGEDASIMAALIDELEADPLLNRWQKVAIIAFVQKFHPTILARAPAGTGKTTMLGEAIAFLRKYRSKILALLTSTNNLAVEKLVEDIVLARNRHDRLPGITGLEDILYVQSNAARVGDALIPHQKHPCLEACDLVTHAQRVLEDYDQERIPANNPMSKRQAEQLQAYINNRRNFPSYYMPDDKVLKLVISHSPGLRIVVATMGKIFMQPGLLEIADVLCVDECQQTRMVDVKTMVSHGKNIKQLFLTGDDKQLAPYVHPDWEKKDHHYRYGIHSVADFFVAFLEGRIIPLDTTYRFHEAMVPYISETLYDGQLRHGGPSVIRRRAVEFHIPVTTREVPIILVHSTGQSHASHGKSLSNPEQEDIAINIVDMLRKLDPDASVTVLCCYAATAKNIETGCQHLMTAGTGALKVSTIPAYIGNEADYEIFVTSRVSSSRLAEADFVHEPRATTVALTRAKEC
jgi:superfamily I DNA and/or RNA helicase